MKSFLKVLLTVVLGWGLAYSAEAQTLRGGVKDAKGEPVIGATVVVEGTSLGISTNVDGTFELKLPDAKNNVLLISYVGMKSQRIPVAGKTQIEVVLEEDATALDDVVVIGYGVVKRRDLTGSVASVTGEKLAANPVSNIAQALQGQLPGVSVTSQDGRPGASMALRVRGGNSMTQSNDPLFIVDGVQVSTIDDIPADNIESIDVLKDAASTAIYGARGANGVILITTKGGSKDQKAIVRYGMYYQIKTLPEVLESMSAYDMVYNSWAYMTAYNPTMAEGVAKYYGLGSQYGNHLNDYKNVEAHNYMNDVMRTAGTWNHDLSLSGGSENTQYYASINYNDDEGIRIGTNFRRWNANFKLTQKITKKLTFDVDLRYADIKREGDNYDVATSAHRSIPIDNPLGSGDPTDLGMGSGNVEDTGNPLKVLDNVTNIQTWQRIRAKAGLTWQAFKGFTAKTDLSLGRNWGETKYRNRGLGRANNYAYLNKTDGYNIRWATTLNYEVQGLGDDHNLSFLVGNELITSKSNSSRFTGYGYPDSYTFDQIFGMMNAYDYSVSPSTFTTSIGTPSNTVSFFGRANYSYKGKYLFTATLRADGSSKFSPNNHWGYFPAAAVAWRISDERFMEGAKGWLDNLKLRLSVGTSGADNISADQWSSTWESTSVTVDGVSLPSYKPNSMKPNYDLKWETTTSRNLGIDFSMWNGRLRGTIDAYWNTTKNSLMYVPIDASTGFSYQFQNVGKTSNKGIEIGLGADLVRKQDFNLTLNVSYSFNKSNIDDIDPSILADTHTGWGSTMRQPYYDYIIRKGQPIGLIQGYVSNGFYTVDDFDVVNGSYVLKAGVIDNTAEGLNYPAALRSAFNTPEGQSAFPGMVKFKDVDGDGIVTGADVTSIGETMPKHTGGFTLNGNWKNLDFSAGFTYQIGGAVYNATAMLAFMGNKDTNIGMNRIAAVGESFKYYQPDASGDLQFVTDPAALAALNKDTRYPTFFNEYGQVVSDWIEDASYLRLQTLTIGYSLPKRWLKKIGIGNFRIYFTGSNLFCLSGYSGLDPDVNTAATTGNFPTPNYDLNAYPKARTYTFGANITF